MGSYRALCYIFPPSDWAGIFCLILLTDRQTNRTKNITSLAEVITKEVGVFTAKALRPYLVVTDSGFHHLMKRNESRYDVPSRTNFSSKVVPELYETSRGEIEMGLTQTLSHASSPLRVGPAE